MLENTDTLTGQGEGHLCPRADGEALGARVHRDVLAPLLQLKDAAARSGFHLEVESGFRSFRRQLSIWNRKATGQLPVLDSKAEPLEVQQLGAKDLVFAILRWSALPGASRHHWGTDLDVFDAAARPPGYEIELIPEEVDPGGMFGPLHGWLDQRMAASESFGFFRPYDEDRGGVAPERWHLSCAPVAEPLERQLTVGHLRDTIRKSEVELKGVVLDHLEEIYQRFVINIGRPPA